MNPISTIEDVASDGTAAASAVPVDLEPYLRAIDGLRRIGRQFYARGWSVGTSSNYSVVVSREPCQLLITASGKDKGALARDDFVLVDRSGQPVFEHQPKSSAETLLHCLLIEQPDVGAVLHTHSIWGTLLSDYFADQGGIAIEGFEMLKGLEGITTHEHREWVDVFENSQDIPQLATVIRGKWQHQDRSKIHGFLLRQHGLYTWGQDLFAARRHVEILEFLFECIARKIGLQAKPV